MFDLLLYRKDAYTRVLLDPIHAMMRVTGEVPKKHSFRWIFCLRFAEAMFHYNEDDKKKIEKHLEKEGVTFESRLLNNTK